MPGSPRAGRDGATTSGSSWCSSRPHDEAARGRGSRLRSAGTGKGGAEKEPVPRAGRVVHRGRGRDARPAGQERVREEDRKSTRLNSSHGYISYAVFCLKKKKHMRINAD